MPAPTSRGKWRPSSPLRTRSDFQSEAVSMIDPPFRSPRTKLGGLHHLGRMMDKIRCDLAACCRRSIARYLGLSVALDGFLCGFLRVQFADVRQKISEGLSDDEMFEWCFATCLPRIRCNAASGTGFPLNSSGAIWQPPSSKPSNRRTDWRIARISSLPSTSSTSRNAGEPRKKDEYENEKAYCVIGCFASVQKYPIRTVRKTQGVATKAHRRRTDWKTTS